MRIDLNQFNGMAPMIDPLALGEGFAQVARNCDLRGGVLAPMRGTRFVVASGVANALSIHKFGWQSGSESQWWLTFNQDVDVVKAAYGGDVEERTYFTGAWPIGPGGLKKTRLGMANTGPGPYPTTYLDGSVPAPTNVPIVSASGGTTTVEPELRVYTETFVTSWDEESEPGPGSARVSVNQGGSVSITNLSPAPSGSNAVDRRRIYRSSFTGTEQSDAQLVVELPIATTTYNDTVAQIDLEDTLATRGWDAAPSGLQGLIGHPAQFLVGFKGFDVYFSEPSAPYAFPIAYNQSTQSEVVGLGIMGQTVVALTRDMPMIGVGSTPEEINLENAQVPNDCRGTQSKRGIVCAPSGIYYPTRSGIALMTPSDSDLITKNYMKEDQFAAYSPSTLLGGLWGRRYIGFYSGGSFIIDPETKGIVESTVTASATHMRDDRLYLCSGSNIVAFGEGSPLSYTWKSRKYEFPRRVEMTVAKVIADSYPVNLSLICDGAVVATKTVADSADFTLPIARSGRQFEIELTGTAKVRRAMVAETVEELRDAGA